MNARGRLKRLLHADVPLPGFVRPLIRALYRVGGVAIECVRFAYAKLIASPVVRSLAEVGPGLRVERIPYMIGRGRIVIGRNVYISGKIGFFFARRERLPELHIGDNTFIADLSVISTARCVRIGSDCLLGAGVRVQDNDGHPVDSEKRKARMAVSDEDVQPVTIGDNVWLAPRVQVLKGVTIGDNAIVGAGAVVTTDIPPNTMAAGVPARVIKKG